jgi:hypothetical protein
MGMVPYAPLTLDYRGVNMTKNEWMAKMYGLDRRDDSMRCRVGSYVFDHGQSPLLVGIICDVLDYSEAQVRSELSRIIRRLERYKIPYQLKWHGSKTIELVPAILVK